MIDFWHPTGRPAVRPPVLPAHRPSHGQFGRVSRALARHATTVVVDCGPAGSPGARAAVATADQFVLVTDARSPSPPAVAGQLAGLGRPPVLLLDDPLAAAAVRVAPPSPGAPPDRGRPPARWRRQAHELAMLLVADWPSLGPEDADRPFPRGACASAPGDCKDRR